METERRSSNGGATLKGKKKSRREKKTSVIAWDVQRTSGLDKADSSKRLVKRACADLAKNKRRLTAAQIDWLSHDSTGEVSSEEEKQSLLAWVEKGMQLNHDVESMQEWKRCSTFNCLIKHSVEELSRTLNGVNGSLKQAMFVANPLMNNDKQILSRSSKGQVSDSSLFEEDSLPITENGSYLHHPCDADIVPLGKDSNPNPTSNGVIAHKNKRKREVDKVLEYVNKRCVVVKTPSGALKGKCQTRKSVVTAWGRSINVTLTSEACAVEEWISSQHGHLFGLDVEWRPNRLKGQRNKVALLQLSNEEECLIIQILFLDKQPHALRKLLSDPSKALAGVGVLADGKRLLHDYGLECQGGIELTALAVERLKREELRNVGLKVLMQEVLGLALQKSKRVTLSNWAEERLDEAQVNYACMDAWASFALAKKLLVVS